jgi:hypothetical protein
MRRWLIAWTGISAVSSTRLQSACELANTFILFMPDNGAEGALLVAAPRFGPDTSASKTKKT